MHTKIEGEQKRTKQEKTKVQRKQNNQRERVNDGEQE